MADRGRGRGRGDRGDRGGRGDSGRGRGRGGAGGGGGGGDGSRGGSEQFRGNRGRGGSHDRGDAGGYRGRGGRGDGGDRGGYGRGGGRGGRGDGGDRGGGGGYGRGGDRGGRGGRGGGPRPIPEAFRYGSDPVPSPDERIERLEDSLMAASADPVAEVTQRMAGAAITPGVQLPASAAPKGKGKGKGKGKSGSAASAGASETAGAAAGSSVAVDVSIHGPLGDTGANLPRRPAYGSVGTGSSKAQVIKVWANYFEVNIDDMPDLYQYVIRAYSNEKELKGTFLQRLIKHVVRTHLSGPGLTVASEFKSKLITLSALPQTAISTLGDVRYDGKPFRLEVDGPLPLGADRLRNWLTTMRDDHDVHDLAFPKFQDMMDAIGIIIGHEPRMQQTSSAGATAAVAVGASRFFPADKQTERHALGGTIPLEAIRGYFQSVRPATGRLLLNVNVTHGAFRGTGTGSLADLFDQYEPAQALHKFLKGARVHLRIPGEPSQEFTASGLAPAGGGRRAQFKTPKQIMFQYVEGNKPISGLVPGRQYSVKQYIESRYGKNIRDVPAVNLGKQKKPLYYPAEWCYMLPNQPYNAKLGGNETSEMIKFACRQPAMNATSVTSLGRQVLQLDSNTALFRRYGLSVGEKLLVVNARILPTPAIKYLEQKPVVPSRGTWNLASNRLVQGGKAAGPKDVVWSFVEMSFGYSKIGDIQTAISAFGKFLRENLGVPLSERHQQLQSHTQQFQRYSRDSMAKAVRAVFEEASSPKSGVRLLFFILPDNDKTLYEVIKLAGDTVYGIHTVCMVGRKFTKRTMQAGGGGFDPQYFANVGLKVNLKLGGMNHVLSNAGTDLGIISEGKTMVVGYDVIHPTNLGSRDSGSLPSHVGLVASVDKHLAQWPAYYWAQTGRQEMTSNVLEEAMKSRLRLWEARNNGSGPENILIYRDGVSEGQFAQVVERELPHIRKAYRDRYKNKDPKITVVVSVKRHHTRFFPTETGDRTGNVSCGTVVDRGITLQRYWDFFLTAHAAIQGTSRPARYTVIYDDIFKPRSGGRAADDLERLTYNMCYLFNRATKAVSICPPAYYADLVCTRARVYQAEKFERFEERDTASMVSGQTSATADDALPRVHENLADTMFYV